MPYDLVDGERAVQAGAYRHAFQIFMALCNNAEDPAFFKVSEMALNDQLTADERNQLIAVLREEALKKHNIEAAYNLAILYWRVEPIQDLEKAVEILNICCRAGLPHAYAALVRLFSGVGSQMPQATPEVIMNLLSDGFAAGSIECAWLMAREYLSGAHIKPDQDEAFKWLFVAGRLGHEEARKQILVMQGLESLGRFDHMQEEALSIIETMENRMVRFK